MFLVKPTVIGNFGWFNTASTFSNPSIMYMDDWVPKPLMVILFPSVKVAVACATFGSLYNDLDISRPSIGSTLNSFAVSSDDTSAFTVFIFAMERERTVTSSRSFVLFVASASETVRVKSDLNSTSLLSIPANSLLPGVLTMYVPFKERPIKTACPLSFDITESV